MQSKSIIAFLIVALTATAVSAQLLPASDSDLASDVLNVAPRLKGVEVPREAASLSWPLAADANLELPEPHISRSREYFIDVTAAELAQGIPVYTTRSGALVRLNPAAGGEIADKAAIAPASLILVDAKGQSWGAGSGMDLMVGPEELKAAGAPFAEGTSAFRIRQELGAGTFTLIASGLAASSESYVLHVFDQASPLKLELTTGASEYLHGQTLTVEASLRDGKRQVTARRVEGFVTSPAGRAWPLTFTMGDDGVYRASLVLDALELPTPGLWEVHASVDGHVSGQAVLRAARTAFACAVPSARFSGQVDIDREGGLGFRLGVESVSASRYEARGVLYATAADGSLRPAGIAHSAAWLEAGDGSLELRYEPKLLAASGLTAPFELRDLRLVDQVRMGLLHRQERALTTR